jgi:LCP family protein required for cell wall assembly
VPDRPPTFDVPDQGDEPVVWNPQRREFVPVPPAPARPASGGAPARQWFVGQDAVGKAPPPRDGTPPQAPPAGPGLTAAAPVAAPAAAAAAAYAAVAPPRRPAVPRPQPAAAAPPAAPPPAAPRARRRRRFLRRPKLRWIFAFLLLLPILLGLFGYWYASSKFDEIGRVPVAAVLSPPSGDGTNYLIVGSDSREAVADAGATDPNVQQGGEAPAGQRSDTMLILRITDGDGARIMSIPRDLFVTLPDGDEGRINGAFNDGPSALIQTIQSNLDIPVHRYIEVDFVSFSGLVDALDGITLSAELVPCPAFDDASGLFLPSAGPIVVDGATALSFVRSRHYTQDCGDGPETDPTGDLGRITRQQAFLRTVLADAGGSRNPLTLMRIADSVTGGLRIDDGMGLTDAVRFAWDMGKLDPVSFVLPTFDFRTPAGAAVLGLVESEAPAVLDNFR